MVKKIIAGMLCLLFFSIPVFADQELDVDANGKIDDALLPIGTSLQAYDAELAALAALTFADASIVQLTGAAAVATLTSGGNSYFLKSTSDNSALEFASPADSRTALGLVIGTNVQAYDADLTTYAGITPSADIQTFLAYANLAAMKGGLSVDDLVTLSGVADGAVNLGTFTGSTIEDSQTIKAALQALETSVEGKLSTAGTDIIKDTHIDWGSGAGQVNSADIGAEPALGNPGTTGFVLSSTDAGVRSWVAQSGWYTNLTSFVGQTAWRIFYSNGDGDVTELALGSDGEYLKSNGASLAPSWATPSGASHDAITLDTDAANLLDLSTQEIGLDTQSANYIFAGPAEGAANEPTFRAMVDADIPSTIARDTELHAVVTLGAQSGGLTLSTQAIGTSARIHGYNEYADPNADRLWGWDDSAGTFGAFSLGSGLSFGDATLNLDADLVTISGLTPAAGKVIIGTADPIWSASAWTIADPGAANALVFSDGTNWTRATSISGISIDIGTSVASGHAATLDANGVLQTAFDSLLPDAADGASLGSASAEWSDLYLAAGGVIYGENGQENSLTSSATGWTTNLDLTVGGADLTLKSDGVKLTGSNGSLTILGLGDGQDEDVKIDLNTTANTIVVSSPASSATTVSLSALNLVTTGTISGAIPSTTDADGQTLSAAQQYGYAHWATGAGTTNLVTAVAGMSLVVYSTTAAAVVINPANDDVIILDGTALSAGDSITSASGAGDFIALVSHENGKWVTMGRSGVWTDSN